MENFQKELTPVYYNQAAIKSIRHSKIANITCFPMHWHDRMEIIRVHSGKLYVDNGKEILILQAGDLVVFAPKTPHKGYTECMSVEYDVLMFDVRSFYNETEICKTYLPAIFDGRARYKKIIQDTETIACFDQIMKTANEISLEIIAEIYRLIYLLMERGSIELRDEKSRDETVMEMIGYIEEHFEEEVTVTKLAKRYGYSKEHFCRKFKEATGLTPMKYLGIYRMEVAEKMLKHTNQSVSEIAEKCGFYDANYFTRRFKAHFGMAPTKYIREREQKDEKSK